MEEKDVQGLINFLTGAELSGVKVEVITNRARRLYITKSAKKLADVPRDIEDYVHAMFDVCANNGQRTVNATDLYALFLKTFPGISQRMLGLYLTALGYRKFKGHGVIKYIVQNKNKDLTNEENVID